jgi:hypothetical protein
MLLQLDNLYKFLLIVDDTCLIIELLFFVLNLKKCSVGTALFLGTYNGIWIQKDTLYYWREDFKSNNGI